MASNLVSFAAFATLSAIIGAIVAKRTTLRELEYRADKRLPRGR